jgi:hypothetical protein
MYKCWFRESLIWRQPFVDDGIGALGVQLDPLVGTSDDNRHPLSSRVEFTNIQNLIFLVVP